MTNKMNLEIYKDVPFLITKDSAKIFKEYLSPKDSILDIGGATGEFLKAFNDQIFPIEGVVIDSDRSCIDYGNKHYNPPIEFVYGDFPYIEYPYDDRKYDLVTMWSLFPHFEDWKTILKAMVARARKAISFSSIVKKNGPTVTDVDLSYFYYLNTGKRIPQVIHNIIELVNFLCIEGLRVKKILCWGESIIDKEIMDQLKGKDVFKVKGTWHVFRNIPIYDVYRADWFIELYKPEDNPKRMGGVGGQRQNIEGYKFYIPEISVWLDEKFYFGAEDNCWTYEVPKELK